jgi:hypothetical protein
LREELAKHRAVGDDELDDDVKLKVEKWKELLEKYKDKYKE